MATRFYLPASGAAPVSPTPGAEWEHVNSVSRPLNSVKGSTAMASVTYTPDAVDDIADKDSLFAQFVSATLFPAQTMLAQNIEICVRANEDNSTNNLFLTWKIYAVDVAGAVLGTLLAIRRSASETTLTLRAWLDSATTTEFIAAESFYLVLEVGLGGLPVPSAAVNAHNGVMSFGEDHAEDLLDTNTVARNPWLQFANDIIPSAVGGSGGGPLTGRLV